MLGSRQLHRLSSHQQGACSQPALRCRKLTRSRCRQVVQCSKDAGISELVSRRMALSIALASAGALASLPTPPPAAADDFIESSSGLRVLDIKRGEGATPQPGDVVVIHWAGYTKGYQGKRFGNSSVADQPLEFVFGAQPPQVIPAVEEAVSSMSVGGIRRIEVPGERPELSYPRDRSLRYKDGFNYRLGPQPLELGGQRALDFVLDNQTLSDVNRTLLIDVKLLAVRKQR